MTTGSGLDSGFVRPILFENTDKGCNLYSRGIT